MSDCDDTGHIILPILCPTPRSPPATASFTVPVIV